LHEFIRQATEEFNLSLSVDMNLKLAIEEAVVNVILYAYPGETDKDIFISFDADREGLTICITDYGIAFDPTAMKAPDITLPLEQRPVGGLGAYLVKQLMTKVSYTRSGDKNILTLIKKIY
jgi:anti-sigma regulatory factor (Ser/Thr protein kinase)